MMILAKVGCLLLLASLTFAEKSCVDVLEADFYILCDSSGSIANVGWGRALKFIVSFSRVFPLGPKAVQIGLGIFDNKFVHKFDLNKYTDHDEFSEEVLNIKQLKGTTFTDKALDAVREEGFLTSADHGSRPGVKKYLLVITDGLSDNRERTLASAEKLRNEGITIVCIGVGLADKTEILGIAGGIEENVFSVHSFNELETFKERITQRICTANKETTAAPVTSSPVTETTPAQCKPQVKQCTPDLPACITFVIASSAGVSSENYNRLFQFVDKTVSGFTPVTSDPRFSLITYGGCTEKVFNNTQDRHYIAQKLQKVNYLNSGTANTWLGLRSSACQFTTCQGCPSDNRKIVVLVTDKKSADTYETLELAQELKEKGIEIITLGIKPGADQTELSKAASKPEYGLQVEGYSDLDQYASSVSDLICDALRKPEVKQCTPDLPTCVTFLTASSAGVSSENYNRLFQFVDKTVSGFTPGTSDPRFSLITYGGCTEKVFNNTQDRDYIAQKLQKVNYLNSGTSNTWLGLRSSACQFTTCQGCPSDNRKIVVLVTDKKSADTDETLDLAQELHEKGIEIITLGIKPGADQTELSKVASKPEYDLQVDGYYDLVNHASRVSGYICDASK